MSKEQSSDLKLSPEENNPLFLLVNVGHAFSSHEFYQLPAAKTHASHHALPWQHPSNRLSTFSLLNNYCALPYSSLELFGINKWVWVYFCNYKVWHMQLTNPLLLTHWEDCVKGIYSPEVCPNPKSDNSHKQGSSEPCHLQQSPTSTPAAQQMQGIQISLPHGYAHANCNMPQTKKCVLWQLPWIMKQMTLVICVFIL